jgi:hypothetical protein
MALPRRERRLAEAIDREVTSADPRLARLFRVFGRCWAGEPVPDREQLRRGRDGFWPRLWDALCAGAWEVSVEPTMADVIRGAGTGPAAIDAVPDQPERAPGRTRRDRREGEG